MANEEAKQKKQAEVGVSQQPMAAGSETTKKWSQLVAQAWADQKFKQRLLDDPKAVLREQGIKVPAGVEVRVVEPTDKLLYFVLPPKPADAGELTSSQLTGVAGGDIRIRKVHHCWRYDKDPRLWVSARITVIPAPKFGITAMRWLPVRNAKRESTVPLLIA